MQRRWCDDSLWVEAALLQLQHKTNQSHVHVTPSVKDSSTCVLVGPTVLISHSSTGVGSLWSDPRSAGGVGQADSRKGRRGGLVQGMKMSPKRKQIQFPEVSAEGLCVLCGTAFPNV